MTTTNVHVLHPAAPQLAAFLRVGHTGQQKLEALHAANRLSYKRVVFDAAHVRGQRDLFTLLSNAGFEIVLDLNVAETAAPGRYGSAVRKLPWGNPERPWTPSDFSSLRNDDFCRRMAEFAVEMGVSAVLAPTHSVGEKSDDWRAVDLASCARLRTELDRAGGGSIGIDYQVIITTRDLRDATRRATAINDISALPVQNVWLRMSGFGATATGSGTRHVIEAIRDLHAIGRPLVIDMTGGFAGLSALAFGAVGGISHGVAEKESFDLAGWRKVPPERRGGGMQARMYVADLDRYLTEEQASVFFAARGTKARFGCNDTTCCHAGIDDMMENGHAHFITQRSRQIDQLARVPEGRRAEHFLLHDLDPAVRSLRQAAKLKYSDDGVQKLVGDAKARLTRLRDALGALHGVDAGEFSCSRVPAFRGGAGRGGTAVAVVGWQS